MIKFIIDWIETKYKIWKYYRKWGYYKVPPLTVEMYENFYVDLDQQDVVDDMAKPGGFVYTNHRIGLKGFPFKTKQE